MYGHLTENEDHCKCKSENEIHCDKSENESSPKSAAGQKEAIAPDRSANAESGQKSPPSRGRFAC